MGQKKWLSLLVLAAFLGCAEQTKDIAEVSETSDEDVIASAEIVMDEGAEPGSIVASSNNPADMFDGLKATYEKQMKEFRAAIDGAAEEDRKKIFDEKYPKPQNYVSEFMHIADTHPDSQAAEESLFWIAQNLRGDKRQKIAVDRLFENHIEAEGMVQLCFQLMYERKSGGANERLQRLVDESPHRQVKGIATYCLASFLRRHELDDENKEEYVGLFKKVVDDYGDVQFRDRPIAKMAEGALFEIERLAVGATAPDIEGEDLDGKAFKLSEYRGKVVMLDFWGDW